MFSWTIDGKEYTAPQGYGEITVADFTAYMATVATIKPAKPRASIVGRIGKGIIARLTAKVKAKKQQLEQQRADAEHDWLKVMEFELAFVQHWLKLPFDVASRIDFTEISALHNFLLKSWGSWSPTERIAAFTHGGKTYDVDYSIDTLGAIDHKADLSVILSHICTHKGKHPSPRLMGGVSLHVLASIMHEVARRQKAIGSIVGASILESFKI